MSAYPSVLGEVETLARILAGASIARYGDGELKMADRVVGIKSQRPDAALTARLRAILLDSGACLVGIPNIHSNTPKAPHWGKYTIYSRLLADRPYVSAFISRPDSAPWINTPSYWQALETLWRDQDITVVRGSGKSLTSDDLLTAKTVTEIIAPRNSAFSEYDSILERILSANPRRVLIGLGPTATVLAVDLCARGIHAVDLGHAALFLRKYLRGEPMVVTEEDKSQDRVPA